jgi:hypothetical protein
VATTTGLVHKLTVGDAVSCAWIGPTPNNATLLLIRNDGSARDSAFAGSLVETLSTALTNYRAVVAIHGDNDSDITSLRIEPV